MATIDQQFVEYIAKTIVSNPSKVSVARTIDERGVLLTLSVDPEDIGKVIGRRGSCAQSLRTLLRALGTKNEARYNLKIVDANAPERPLAPTDTKTAESTDTSADAADSAADKDSEAEEEFDFNGDGIKDSSYLKRTRAELADLDDELEL